MIGISADFDPVHKGHVKLIEKAREIADKKDSEVVIYLNKGFSANHAPFFTPFEARREMALANGADKVVAIEGLHHRLTLAYSVPIRIAMMIEDGVTDYVDAANVSPLKIEKYSKKFVQQGIFVGIPQDLPNRNVIRWFAVNDFLKDKYGKNMKFHIIPELEVQGKISGREIRKSILENNMKIPEETKEILPEATIAILDKYLKNGSIPSLRNWKGIYSKLNTSSRSNLMKIAYLSGNALNSLIKGRMFREEESVWAAFRRAGYGPVLTRLAISTIEEDVNREEVLKLMRDYEKKGVIPHEQSIDKVIERAWFIANQNEKGIAAFQANEDFKEKSINIDKRTIKAPLKILGGLNLTKLEVKKIEDGLEGKLFIDKDGKIATEIRKNKFKVKTKLKLPGMEVSYLRYLIDSHFIPLSAKVIKNDSGYRLEIQIHNY